MTDINFSIVWEDAQSGEYGSPEDPSPYFGLSREKLSRSLNGLQNPDEKVIDKSYIRVLFDYPLETEHILTLVPPDGKEYFTRASLGKAIALKYQEIYDEEEKTTELPVETLAQRMAKEGKECYLINRAETNGNWGIWGHALGDLDLHTVSYDNQQDYYTLGIDS